MLRDIFGRLIFGLSPIIYYIGGIWGFFATFGWLYDKIGNIPSIICLLFFPISMPVSALIAGFSDGNWSIAAIGFVGVVAGYVTGIVGGLILNR